MSIFFSMSRLLTLVLLCAVHCSCYMSSMSGLRIGVQSSSRLFSSTKKEEKKEQLCEWRWPPYLILFIYDRLIYERTTNVIKHSRPTILINPQRHRLQVPLPPRKGPLSFLQNRPPLGRPPLLRYLQQQDLSRPFRLIRPRLAH